MNGKKICGILQELVTLDGTKFLIIGMGVNLVSNPKLNTRYKATNILAETKKEPKIREIVDLIVLSYEKFFVNINSYNYINFKKKSDLMVLN